ncbi:MAG: DinB family protein [Terriglobia bacterium]
MVPLSTVRELYDYNYWARDCQLKACAGLSQEQFLRPLGNSFSSLRDTLVHLVGAEWIWLERWRGRCPRAILAAEEFPTLAEVESRWRNLERELRDYLAGLKEEALAGSVTYVNTKGVTWTYPLWRLMLHLVNHQSYHRGQVTMMLRLLGVQPPSIDYLVAHDTHFRP